jgi:hypothetical protein
MAKDLTTTEFEAIQPEGLALALMVTTIVFTVLSTIVVALRFYARISLGLFSIEDWLMLAGWVSKQSFPTSRYQLHRPRFALCLTTNPPCLAHQPWT